MHVDGFTSIERPQTGDLLITRNPSSGQFVIADAITHRVLSGPFPGFSEAAVVAASHAHKIGVAVWQENADPRGLASPPILLNFQGK